jgi:type I restriction enzyme S subunit
VKELPIGWTHAPLFEISQIQGGIQKQAKRRPDKNPYPFLRVANVTPSGLDLREVHSVELFAGEIEKFRLMRGDLLVVEGNGSPDQIGRAAVWDGSIPDAVHQNHLIRVRPGPTVLPKYLGLVWNSPETRERLTSVASSTSGLHTLSVSKLKAIGLPLPPLDEQQRIVEILEDHLSRLDAAASALEVAVGRVDVYEEARVVRSPELVNAPRCYLADLLSEPLANGRSVQTAEDGFPVLRLTAMRDGHIDLNERKIGRWSPDDATPFLAARGDIMVARGNGSLRLVGRAALVSQEPSPAVAFPDTMIRIRHAPGLVRGDFLTTIWNSRIVRRQIEAVARTTAGIYKVNQRDLAAIYLPVPLLSVQASLMDRLATETEGLRVVRRAVRDSMHRAAALRRALLAAAFSGRLTGASSDLDQVEELASV